MILDSRLELADAFTIPTGAATTVLGTSNMAIDTGSVVRDLGNGEDIYLFITVDTAITHGAGTGTLKFDLVTSANADGSSGTVLASSRTITVPAAANAATNTLAGSTFWSIPLPQGVAYARYLAVQSVVATGITAGKVNIFFTKDKAGNVPYPSVTNA